MAKIGAHMSMAGGHDRARRRQLVGVRAGRGHEAGEQEQRSDREAGTARRRRGAHDAGTSTSRMLKRRRFQNARLRPKLPSETR